ncbi:MAG TPA: NAD(P)-binding domain-containing protein, partial [Kofleriaceae bacterium]|nr:NAD(P)-binding domain-containing protein [Kofleriaceae bacterium]
MASPIKIAAGGRARRISSISDQTVGVVGAGAFATALASVLSTRGTAAILQTDDAEVVRDININHRNEARLPGVSLSRRVAATSDLAELASLCRLVVLAVSSRHVVRVTRELGGFLDEDHIVAHAVGALAGDDRRVSQILRDNTPVTAIAALAGPALPRDLSARRACAVVAASESDDALAAIKEHLQVPSVLRVYKNRDLAGVELSAALAGAFTVAMGVADGLGVGHGPRTVLLTRAAAEGALLCRQSGGQPGTFYGLSGLGNLLARSSPESRGDSEDYQLGVALARGEPPPRGDTEGVRTLVTACRIGDLLGLEVPIVRTVRDIVAGRLSAE